MALVTSDVQQLFDDAKNIVFLTGAGVSTASGIPDYRSKGGIYDGMTLRPEYLLSTEALAKEPEKMYEFAKENMYFPDAQPNIIHQKMAELTQKNCARIITQNVDSLHLKAGAKNVIEFHGSLYNIYATKDGKPSDVNTYLHSLYREDGALLRPAITLYGEIPFRVDEAAQWMSQADLVVIVGTSFVVYPFAGLLQYARPNVPILAVNLEKIPAPAHVEQIVGDAREFFSELQV
ncbi:NAD-dependent protein deacylase [Weissella paramesenteroides]|uniref:NAD-dependent protein deacylase n=1 Tax=Weissella paramesenteroides TaxID=1249 RepID=UPI0018DAD179|nr:NAD-dependent protein deacylase [Weissella paramesenteroides]QPI47241.1 NAD-dependent protein deacylase [Weissella paramesenteroides]